MTITTKHLSTWMLAGILANCGGWVLTEAAHAESLFRAGIAYQTSQPYTPRSLFAIPRPSTIGDTITIRIDETTQVNVQNNVTLSKEQTITENSTGFWNGIIRRIIKRDNVLPEVNGIDNQHEISTTARGQKSYAFKDSITCQVVQVLPNGHLVVQGKKTVFANQEQQDLYLSGIVNPYFLNASNTINSQQVANLQMNVTGRGVMTRQQGDGIIGKYFQFLN